MKQGGLPRYVYPGAHGGFFVTIRGKYLGFFKDAAQAESVALAFVAENPPKTLRERFDERWEPVPECGCWIWTSYEDSKGYGVLSVNRKALKAHRVAYELYVGPIPKGLFVCHRCDVGLPLGSGSLCVNPDHLFLGTQQDNMSDRVRKDRTRRGTLGFPRGVHANGRRFAAEAQFKKVKYYLGTHDTVEEAESSAIAFRKRAYSR